MLTPASKLAENPSMPDNPAEKDPEGSEAEGIPSSPPGWASLVGRIQTGDQQSLEELYRIFSKGIRFFLCRHLGPQELEDKVHDTFLIVVQAIQRGELREPDRLMGFVRTIVRRQIASYIDIAVQTRREQVEFESGIAVIDGAADPERDAIGHEEEQLMRQVLNELSSRDREILVRFYLREQAQDLICEEMQLTETQFRLLKSRAKARFGELGRRRLQTRGLGSFFLRNNPGGLHLLH